jgi:hypothetical protein
VTAANYGPLLDISHEEALYPEIDKLLTETLKKILETQQTNEELIKFATTTMQNGGLQLIYPNVYKEIMF